MPDTGNSPVGTPPTAAQITQHKTVMGLNNVPNVNATNCDNHVSGTNNKVFTTAEKAKLNDINLDPLYILGQGQSNMGCALTNFGADLETNPLVKIWNNASTNAWETWIPNSDPTQIRNSVRNPPLIAFSFAKKIQEITGREIRVLINAKASQSISTFLTVANGGTAENWNDLTADLALANIPDNAIVARLFALGETDSVNGQDPITWFKPRYELLQSQFEALPEVCDNCPTLVIEQLAEGTTTNSMNAYWDTLAGDTTGKQIVVPTRNLVSVPDNLHYDGNGAIAVGRYYLPTALFSAQSLSNSGGGGGTWGSITGTLANQTDLATALADKASAAQGALADSALQPGANISTLTNDAGYTGDQTDAQIETAYNAQVPRISGPEITAGTETNIRRVSPNDLKAAVEAHSSGGSWGSITGTLSNQTDLQGELNNKLGDAPVDANGYVRKGAAWTPEGTSGLQDAPANGSEYARKDGAWVVATASGGTPADAATNEEAFQGTLGTKALTPLNANYFAAKPFYISDYSQFYEYGKTGSASTLRLGGNWVWVDTGSTASSAIRMVPFWTGQAFRYSNQPAGRFMFNTLCSFSFLFQHDAGTTNGETFVTLSNKSVTSTSIGFSNTNFVIGIRISNDTLYGVLGDGTTLNQSLGSAPILTSGGNKVTGEMVIVRDGAGNTNWWYNRALIATNIDTITSTVTLMHPSVEVANNADAARQQVQIGALFVR